ncbi:MAG: hypothetical protein M4579_002959 [Chaenotheca gracillima]|nr:MAG: hypothetical protein M4579_002959 [Chaenotheca gracillima]
MPPIGEHTLEDGTTKSPLPPQSVLQAVLWPAAQVGLFTGGRRHVIPGATTHSIVGLVGQATYSHVKADTIDSGGAKPQHKNPIWVRLLSSKWSPTKVLTDEEYEAILQEKLLRVNADIAIVDENIRNLVKEQSKQK